MLLGLGLKRARPITNAFGRLQLFTSLKFTPDVWLLSGQYRPLDSGYGV